MADDDLPFVLEARVFLETFRFFAFFLTALFFMVFLGRFMCNGDYGSREVTHIQSNAISKNRPLKRSVFVSSIKNAITLSGQY